MSNYYTLLHVSDSADQAEIEEAYHRTMALVRQKIAEGEPPSPESFERMNEAFAVLRDPERRARYDIGRRDSQFAEQITLPADKPMKVAVKSRTRARLLTVLAVGLFFCVLALVMAMHS